MTYQLNKDLNKYFKPSKPSWEFLFAEFVSLEFNELEGTLDSLVLSRGIRVLCGRLLHFFTSSRVMSSGCGVGKQKELPFPTFLHDDSFAYAYFLFFNFLFSSIFSIYFHFVLNLCGKYCEFTYKKKICGSDNFFVFLGIYRKFNSSFFCFNEDHPSDGHLESMYTALFFLPQFMNTYISLNTILSSQRVRAGFK